MIYLITKYHEIEGGKTASAVKVEKANEAEAMAEALKQFHQFASNYMADTTVKAWSLMIVDPHYNTVIKKDGYTVPVPVVEEPSAE